MTAAQWLEVVTSVSVQVLLVVLACALLERGIVATHHRCAIWTKCFLCVIALVGAALIKPRLHLFQPWGEVEPQTLLTVSKVEGVVGTLLLAVWGVGVIALLSRWFVRSHMLRRMLSHCEELPPSEVVKLFGTTQLAVNEQPLPTVLISDSVPGPFCWQLHRPTIILPRFLLSVGNDDLKHVLVHELKHLATHHPVQLFWQHIVQVFCWFHPAIWSAGARASLLREFTCDEAAASNGDNCAGYLRTLLLIAERCENSQNSSAIAFGRAPNEIVLRARRLVELSNRSKGNVPHRRQSLHMATLSLIAVTLLASFVWIPTDPFASSRSLWSPWPSWSARVAHCFGITLHDFEQYDRRTQKFEVARQAKSSTDAIFNNKIAHDR